MTDILPLSGRLDLATVGSLHAMLKPRLGADMILDLSAVTQLGALGLQVLIAAAQAVRRQGKTFELRGVPPAVDAQMAAMGFTADQIERGGS